MPAMTLCDRCGLEKPEDETQTCRCGAQVCDDCSLPHQQECEENDDPD